VIPDNTGAIQGRSKIPNDQWMKSIVNNVEASERRFDYLAWRDFAPADAPGEFQAIAIAQRIIGEGMYSC
jgi:hypothetical protein